jgi:outer membrane murein-binding lipoprotein Lpp
MSNWFEDNPSKSVVAHTILVAATTWAISTFVLDSSKVDNLETVIKTLQAKIDVLGNDNAVLRETNARYEQALRSSPGTLPYYESEIASLKKDKASLENAAAEKGTPSSARTSKLYAATETRKVGEAVVDPETGLTIGINSINTSYLATGILTLPGQTSVQLQDVGAGTMWEFNTGSRSFRLALAKVNWINDSYTVEVREREPASGRK